MSVPALPDGWTVWSEESGGRVILAYRPDVFDSEAFPAACLPTLVVGPGRRPDLPPERRVGSGDWYVALYLEPTLRLRSCDAAFGSRDEAVEEAARLAAAFAAGEIAYRDAYEGGRAGYLDRLDRLVGREG